MEKIENFPRDCHNHIIEPTMNLKWFNETIIIGETENGMTYGKDVKVLKQEWLCIECSHREWIKIEED